MSSPPPKLTTWPRAPVRRPFDAEEHNRLVRHANGELAAPQTWTADDGTLGLAWDPSAPKLDVGAQLEAAGDLTVGGDLDVAGDLAAGGGLAVHGPATFDGPMTLGDLPADTIHVKGTLLLDVPLPATAPPDNSVTSAKIVNGTIVNADISPTADIDASKLLNGTVTSAKIADGTIQTVDLAAGCCTQRASVPFFTGTRTAAGFADVDSTNGKITLTTTGGDLLVAFTGYASNSAASIVQRVAVRLDAGSETGVISVYSLPGAATYPMSFAVVVLFTGVTAASHTIAARHTNDSAAGTMTTGGYLVAVELRR